MPTQIDRRRLRDGARALALPVPQTDAEIREQLPVILDAIRAMQSLDDLGSEEANGKAWDDLGQLEARYRQYRQRLGESD